MVVKYLIVFLALLSSPVSAQSKRTGLGPFTIGVSTPDSLSRTYFREQAEPVVKGTIALPCTHIRIFKADEVQWAGVSVRKLFLVFYDNRLFQITCPYDPALQKAFVQQHGAGLPRPDRKLTLCQEGADKPMLLRSQVWQMGDVRALAVEASGYNAQCQQVRESRLTLASQSILAISSECDLEDLDPDFARNWVKP